MSGIEWTDRSDWNPLRGCTRVSEGCRHCYAEQIAARFSGQGQPFHGYAEKKGGEARWTGKVDLIELRLTLPLTWRRPARIFVNSASDLFHEDMPDAGIDKVFDTMARARWHTFQILTKRSARMRDYMNGVDPEKWRSFWSKRLAYKEGIPKLGIPPSQPMWPLPNVWLGVSCEDQRRADERIPHLLATPAAVRFVSAEPLLGDLEIIDYLRPLKVYEGGFADDLAAPSLDWVICGGESGKGHRPMEMEWAKSLYFQCKDSGTAYFFKQDSGPRSGERGRASDALWSAKEFPVPPSRLAEDMENE